MIVFSFLALESPAFGDHVAPGFEELAKWGPSAKLVGLFDSSRTISELKLLSVNVRAALLAGCSLDKPVELRVTQRFRKGAHLERNFHLGAILNVRGFEGMASVVGRVKTSLLEAMQLERGQEGRHGYARMLEHGCAWICLKSRARGAPERRTPVEERHPRLAGVKLALVEGDQHIRRHPFGAQELVEELNLVLAPHRVNC